MAERSGFFPYVVGDANSEYTSDWLAKYIASIVSNGVYNGELGLTANGSAMSVTLPAGRAWINGYFYCNDADLALTIANADGVLARKDTIVLRWDINARSITAQVLTGTPASTAVAPAIVRTVEQYDLKLAEISIPAGTTAITQTLIADTRLDNDVCGIVTGAITQVDTTTFYNQIKADLADFKSTNEADFSAWLSSIKGKLSEDAAGNLQSEIDAHKSDKNNPHGVTAEQVGAVAKISTTTPNIADASNPDDYVWLPYKASDTNFCGIACDASGNFVIALPKGDGTLNKYTFAVGNAALYVNGVDIKSGGHAATADCENPQIINKEVPLNKFTNAGRYIFTDTWMRQNYLYLDMPINDIGYLDVIVDSNNGVITHKYTANDSGKEFVRRRVNGTWMSWIETVRIIASDNNTSNQHYVKFSDGRLIAWGHFSGAVTVSDAYGSMYQYSGFKVNNIFPTAFTDLNGMSVHAKLRSSGRLLAMGEGLNTDGTGFLFDILSPVAVNNLNFTGSYTVVGR